MTRSRRRKLERLNATGRSRKTLKHASFASALLAGIPAAFAQTPSNGGLEEVVVSAQKRDESLQSVPVSITALGTAKLEELHVTDFNDYAKFLPSLTYQTLGPGAASVYMRGVASGENSNHSGPQPSVGIYLDEQPITTIQGALDVHVYDIARVEALAGPQGTLYGASSQAGTIRIITNKPDPSGFKSAYDLSVNTVDHGGTGYSGEGFVNIPISSNAAIRLVGWRTHDAGFIDNLAGTRTFPTAGITQNNAAIAKKDYNDVDTTGGRAALKVDLNDTWTITPAVMGQRQEANGSFGFDRSRGDLAVVHFLPESTRDHWVQAALTVEGHFSNFDVTYSGAHLNRHFDSSLDYSDYSYFYDVLSGSVAYNNAGELIDPSQGIEGRDRFTKQSHEIRISTAKERRLRAVGGLFFQRQTHNIEQNYHIAGLNDANSVTGWPGTIWLTEQLRVDRDYAVFGELTYDITDKLAVTGGARHFKAKNSIEGFFGYAAATSDNYGENLCGDPSTWVPFRGAPCENLNNSVEDSGTTPRVNFTYKITPDHMVYTTFSKGFRPGGVNRNGTFPPYKPDYLTNYEIGWKTSWMNNRLRINGAVFQQEWKDFQFSFLPPGGSGLTVVENAGQARIKGIESDISWAATGALTISGGFALLDPRLTENYCDTPGPNGETVTDCDEPAARKGIQLPVSAKFKSNLTARYGFGLAGGEAHVQGSLIYQGRVWSDLTAADRAVLGSQSPYALADFSFGLNRGPYSFDIFLKNAFDKRAQLYRYAQCVASTCGGTPYLNTTTPRLIGVQFGQKF
ncbi:MAG: TonB-dependent receptor [Gammaproteobacteria bacterium]